MKGILIDPSNKTVTEVDFNGDYKTIAQLIGAPWYDVVRSNDGLNLFVDDEGLLTNPNQYGYFRIGDYPQTLAGKGLLLGPEDENGDSTGVTFGPERVKVQFIDNPAPESIEPKMEIVTDPDVLLRMFGPNHPLTAKRADER